MKKYLILGLSSCLFYMCFTLPNSSSRLPQEQTRQIEAFVKKAMKEIEVVPGLGIAIVKDGEIAYADGFGYRDVENQLPVTAETGFYLASKTKSFTAMAAASLEHKGQLDLNQSLSHYYPGWAFASSLDATQIPLTQVMGHNHGIRNNAMQFRLAFVDTLPEEEFARLLFDFSRPRGAEFSYSNTSYNIIGDILQRRTGKPWQQVLREEVFDPIGMKHTTAYMSEATKREFAYPYLKEKGQFKRLRVKDDRQMQSAGGHVSTPVDLAKWLITNLNNGQLGGKECIASKVMKRVHQPYAELDREFYDFHRKQYEMGWYRADYEGETLTHHFGSFNGYMTHVSFMPAHQFGVVVLSNELAYGGLLPHLVAAYIYDVLLEKEGLEDKYERQLKKMKKANGDRMEQNEKRLSRKREMLSAAAKPPSWTFNAADFVGIYYSPQYGDFAVKEDSKGGLTATYGTHQGALLPAVKDQFLIDWQLRGYLRPPIELEVKYDREQRMAALSWEGSEFRRLPQGLRPSDLTKVHITLREDLKNIQQLEKEKQANAVRVLLEQHYPSGALTEDYLNNRGYQYLGLKEYEMAIALFQFNVDYYPKSANTYDSLGEAYLAVGEKRKAKVNYQKSLDMDPSNTNAKKVLKKLK